MTSNLKMQWIVILLIPTARISCIWPAKQIVKQLPETNNNEVRFFAETALTNHYTSYVTGRLFTLEQSSVYGLLTVEVALHMIESGQIIRLDARVEGDDEFRTVIAERKKRVQSLAMVEFTEAMLPLVFVIAFTMAYYGPNSSLMIDIGSDYIGGKAIDNVKPVYIDMFLMLGFDVFSMIISWLSLKYFCQINLFQEFCNMMKKHWLIFVVILPGIVIQVGSKDVNYGVDNTGQFLWITEEGRLNMTQNVIH